LEQDDATGEDEQAIVRADGCPRNPWRSRWMIITMGGTAGTGKVDVVSTNPAESDQCRKSKRRASKKMAWFENK
jgi:hypothetical protein